MIIYVICKGEYSDYHICAVTENKEKAKKLEKMFTSEYDEAYIEEYDTEQFLDITDRGYKYYSCSLHYGKLIIKEKINFDYAEEKIRKRGYSHFWADVQAKDEEHAKKIFFDKLAECKYNFYYEE